MFGQFGGQVVSTGNMTFRIWCARSEIDLRLYVLVSTVCVKLGTWTITFFSVMSVEVVLLPFVPQEKAENRMKADSMNIEFLFIIMLLEFKASKLMIFTVG